MPKIMLDAGHTGSKWNKGAVSGYYESAIVWKLHNYLAEELVKRGFTVGKTRKSIETDMDVTARGKAAKGYDLFISLHTNSCDDPSVRRVVGIYQTNDSQGVWDTESKAVADKLAAVVADCMKVTWKNYSKASANDRDGDGKKDDNYYGVLHGSRMVKVAGIIMEHSFHSNSETCRWLMNDSNLRKLAQAEADCLADHYGLSVQKLPSHEKEEPAALPLIVKGATVAIKASAKTYYPGGKTIPEWVKGYCHVVTKDESSGKAVVKGGKTCVLLGEMKKTATAKIEKGINTWVAIDNLELVKDEADSKAPAVEYAKDRSDSYDHKYKVTANGGLHLRTGAGTNKTSIEVMKKGSIFRCYGYFTGEWLYGVSASGKKGFCHKDYLKKV